MADLPSSFSKVNDVEVAQDAPVTESLMSKMGSNDNYLKDERDAIVAVNNSQNSKINELVTNNNNLNVIMRFVDRKPHTLGSGFDPNFDQYSIYVYKDYNRITPDSVLKLIRIDNSGNITSIVEADLGQNPDTWDEVTFHIHRPNGGDSTFWASFWTRYTVPDITAI